MVELHVLITRDSLLLKKCLDSLEFQCLKPIFIHNKNKTILYGRKIAFFKCKESHVSFLDDDDEIKINQSALDCLAEDIPVFTNSEYSKGFGLNSSKVRLMNPNSNFIWSLDNEKKRLITPHQLIIYPLEIALDLLTKTEILIRNNNWHENDCDFIMRLLCSKEYGWIYKNVLTYHWFINSSSIHRRRLYNKTLEIRNYFGL